MDQNTVIIVLGVVLVLALGFFYYLKQGKTKPKAIQHSGLDMNRCIEASGGKDNIVSIGANGSKLTLHVKDVQAVNQEAWKQIGATGIVVSNDKVNIILGKVSEVVAIELNQAMK